MNLQEMLDYTASQYLDDRTDIVDGDNDSLWSDEFLCRQFNEAQRLLARRAWCIITIGEATVGQITLVTNQSLYPLHKSVLRVYDATPSTQVAPLGRSEDIQLRDTSLNSHPGSNFDAWEVGQQASIAGSVNILSGVTLALASDAGTRQLRMFPPPTASQNGIVVALKIARLPINLLTVDDLDAVPEVPEDYHLVVCEYAAGKALTLPNVDGSQKADGRALIASFNDACREARQDRQRAEMGSNRWAFSSVTAVLR